MTITDTLTKALGTVVDTGSQLVLAKAGIGTAPTDQPKAEPAASGLPPEKPTTGVAPVGTVVPRWVWFATAGAVGVAALVFFLKRR